MSILIKELHLPTERLYPLHLTIYSDGSVFCGHGIGKRSYEAIEVPVPHGRLIDADKLRLSSGFSTTTEYGLGRSDQIEAIKSNAPTIIPAEEETT